MIEEPIKVAVIGAGAAGLVAARILSRHGISCKVIEKDDRAGGIWHFRPHDPTHPMYRNLRTNLPREIMAYRELPWTTPLGEKSFVTHTDVLKYLDDYRTFFNLDRYILYGSKVRHLMALTTHESRVKVQEENKNKNDNSLPAIRLEWEQTSNGEVVSEIFDAVVIANGHYSMPSIPAIEGIQNFKGTVLHSVSYDSPEVFRGEIVLCIGGRASGSDLAREISRHAQHVFLSSSTVQSTTSHGNVTFVPKTLSIDEDGGIVFGKSCDVRPHVTTIIYCTGYDYSFPFINETSNLALAAEPKLRCVMPLYKHLWHADYPNVSFIGIPTSVVPFPLFELQIEAVLQQIVTNGQNLPSRLERRLSAERDAQDGGHLQNGRIQDTHFLGNAQWAYCHDLASYAHIDCSEVSRFITTNQRIYDHSHSVRSNGPSTSDSYRGYVYVRDDSDTGFRILETPMEEK